MWIVGDELRSDGHPQAHSFGIRVIGQQRISSNLHNVFQDLSDSHQVTAVRQENSSNERMDVQQV